MKSRYFMIGSIAFAMMVIYIYIDTSFPIQVTSGSGPTTVDTPIETEEKLVPSGNTENQERNLHEKTVAESNQAGYFDPKKIPSREDWQDIAEFHQYHPMWGGRERSGYKYYRQEQLVEMADNGDVQAMRELAHRYSELSAMRNVADMKLSIEPEVNEDGLIVMTDELSAEVQEYYQKQLYYSNKAVIYGDRQLLTRLESFGNARSEVRRLGFAEEPPKGGYDAALEVLAYYEFFGMRGMDDMKYEGMTSFFHEHGDKGVLPDQITDEHVTEIRKRAQAIYDSYEQQRLELGLGPFDNSVPKGKAQEFAWLTPAMVKMIKEETGYEVFW